MTPLKKTLIMGAAATALFSQPCNAQPSNLDQILVQTPSIAYIEGMTYSVPMLSTISLCLYPLTSNYGFSQTNYSGIELDYKPLEELQIKIEYEKDTKEDLDLRINFTDYPLNFNSQFPLSEVLFRAKRSKTKYRVPTISSDWSLAQNQRHFYVDWINYKHGDLISTIDRQDQNYNNNKALNPKIYLTLIKEMTARLADDGNKPAMWIYHQIIQLEKVGKILGELRDAIQGIYIIDLTNPLEDLINPLSELRSFVNSNTSPYNRRKKSKIDIDATIEPSINENRIGSSAITDIYKHIFEGDKLSWGIILNIEIKF